MDNKIRFHYIDFLRVIAILMMFIYHINMIFVAENDWHIKDNSSSNVLMEVNYWMSSFRMPLLFLVSGFISTILLERFSKRNFVFQRFERLIIPTIIWTFILVAPQIYFERKLEGSNFTYLQFYSTFLDFKWYPLGNFHWLHLWFVPYLFFYNILSIPLISYLNKEKIHKRLEFFFEKNYSILLIVIIAILPYTFLATRFPTTHDLINDWGRHSFFIFFVFVGVLLFKFQQILEHLEDKRRFYLRLSVLSIITINVIRWNGLEPFQIWENWIEKPQTYIYIAILNFNSWLWVFTSLGYGRKYLNKKSKILSYCNQAVYPFYILHQTVIVVLAYYVVQTPDNTAFKYVFLLISCLLLTILIYHLFIRPYNPIRKIFGMKKTQKK
ncbi:acyltransferase family protein [uncultured Tenacibaculum sp.]|uniref:acyltransferase family protein n=1 Tax=uncultured Tenacibaculum sp. TaxID=174713 RepID=UPI00262E1E89|nr:acyltransferase family protein [uncultured Tenacibaculum sp.]